MKRRLPSRRGVRLPSEAGGVDAEDGEVRHHHRRRCRRRARPRGVRGSGSVSVRSARTRSSSLASIALGGHPDEYKAAYAWLMDLGEGMRMLAGEDIRSSRQSRYGPEHRPPPASPAIGNAQKSIAWAEPENVSASKSVQRPDWCIPSCPPGRL